MSVKKRPGDLTLDVSHAETFDRHSLSLLNSSHMPLPPYPASAFA